MSYPAILPHPVLSSLPPAGVRVRRLLPPSTPPAPQTPPTPQITDPPVPRSPHPLHLPHPLHGVVPALQPHGLQPVPGGLRLFDAMRLVVAELLHAGARQRIEPYQACRWCRAAGCWCAGGPADTSGAGWAGAEGGFAAWLDDLAARAASSGGLAPVPPLHIGRWADPYPAAEQASGATRRLLEEMAERPHLERDPGLTIAITTRSPLLLRDLDLLLDLDQRHVVSVGVLIPLAPAPSDDTDITDATDITDVTDATNATDATDPSIALQALEPHHPSLATPAERLEMVRILSSYGIATRVVCSPLVPGANNGVPALRRLFDLAGRAGAYDVAAAPRHPALPPTPFEAAQLLPVIERLRLEHGFPLAAAGRG